MKTKRDSHLLGRILYSMLAGLLLGIAALAIYLIQVRMQIPETTFTGPFQVEGAPGVNGILVINPPVVISPFELTNSGGQRVLLSDFRDRYVLLTFGFTHCPDICPLTLNDFGRIQQLMGEFADSIDFVFISVDGKRDTPAALRQYFEFRQLNDIHALTGDEASVLAMGEPFGLSVELNDEGASEGYLINHTSGAFLLDQAGRWIKRYQFGVPPESIAADLIALLNR